MTCTLHIILKLMMTWNFIIIKIIILIVKTIGLCNWTSLVIKWVKRHEFPNSLITSCICPFWQVCKGQSQNAKCVVHYEFKGISKISYMVIPTNDNCTKEWSHENPWDTIEAFHKARKHCWCVHIKFIFIVEN
jgi:hypothetical protein